MPKQRAECAERFEPHGGEFYRYACNASFHNTVDVLGTTARYGVLSAVTIPLDGNITMFFAGRYPP